MNVRLVSQQRVDSQCWGGGLGRVYTTGLACGRHMDRMWVACGWQVACMLGKYRWYAPCMWVACDLHVGGTWGCAPYAGCVWVASALVGGACGSMRVGRLGFVAAAECATSQELIRVFKCSIILAAAAIYSRMVLRFQCSRMASMEGLGDQGTKADKYQ